MPGTDGGAGDVAANKALKSLLLWSLHSENANKCVKRKNQGVRGTGVYTGLQNRK